MKLGKLPATVAAVFACGGLCANAFAGVYSQQLVTPGDFSGGIFDHTETSDAIGGVTLNRSINSVPFLWVPASDEGIISKVDVRLGAERARYRTGPIELLSSPCAVTSDVSGNAYVACAGPGVGRIVKINASKPSKTVGKERELTSFNPNTAASLQALPWGEDSRVSLAAEVGGPGSRPNCLAFDTNGLLWVGLWGEQNMVALDLSKGTAVFTVDLPGKPDTMIAGPSGSLWVLCANVNTVCQVSNTLLGQKVTSFEVKNCGLKSICLGENNTLWLASDAGLVCMNGDSGLYTVQRLPDGAGLTSVATDRRGYVWASCPTRNELIEFAPSGQSVTARVPVGLSPNSVCLDGDGYIWSLNEDSASASRIDPRTAKLSTTVTTGKTPFSSTPFAASVLKPGIYPSGSWRQLFDSGIAGAGWGTISWLESSGGGHLEVAVRSADTPMAIDSQQFIPVTNGQEAAIPNGQYLEVAVSLVGGGNTSPVLRELAVHGRDLPPDVSHATPSMDRIATLDHSMQKVEITGCTDPEGDPVTVAVTGITQDEPVSGLFPGDKAPDATGIGDNTVMLRAECDPGTADHPGNGRTYTITFMATDPDGASTMGKVKVSVPPILKWDAVAIDDHKRFDSTKKPETDLMAKAQ